MSTSSAQASPAKRKDCLSGILASQISINPNRGLRIRCVALNEVPVPRS
jgi:hypothetical protein